MKQLINSLNFSLLYWVCIFIILSSKWPLHWFSWIFRWKICTIYSKIKGTLDDLNIPLKNVIAFYLDTSNVMFGKYNSVSQLLVKDQPWILPVKYSCHLIHSCASHTFLKLQNLHSSVMERLKLLLWTHQSMLKLHFKMKSNTDDKVAATLRQQVLSGMKEGKIQWINNISIHSYSLVYKNNFIIWYYTSNMQFYTSQFLLWEEPLCSYTINNNFGHFWCSSII